LSGAFIRGIFIALILVLPANAGNIISSVDPGALPRSKTTPLGLYLTPADAYRAVTRDPGIVFIDVRDPIEINFVGHAKGIDAIVPLAISSHRFDDTHGGYAMDLNPNFVAEIDAAITREGTSKFDPVILICRSGGRSAAAARMLAKAGYTNVWNLVEGFEGDKNPETGQREVNGWRNAGLPWAYKLNGRIAWHAPGRRPPRTWTPPVHAKAVANRPSALYPVQSSVPAKIVMSTPFVRSAWISASAGSACQSLAAFQSGNSSSARA
jgi:rhodanese-related sulfurtransferase